MTSNNFRFLRRYVGPVKALVLDWSGTVADKYVIAPAVVFVDVFKKHGVPISMIEARGPMGLRKDLHIQALTKTPEIRYKSIDAGAASRWFRRGDEMSEKRLSNMERWKKVHGVYPEQKHVDAMFKDFVPMQLSCLRKYTKLLPGVTQTVDTLRSKHGLKFGSTTGFLRAMVDILLEDSIKQGFTPDCTVAGDEVENGARPKPFMVYKNLDLLNVHPIQSVIKVDDTASGVGEALEAGCWAVGIAKYSNYMDIDSYEHEESLTAEEMQSRLEKSRDILIKTGAHYVIDEFDELIGVVDDVNERLKKGKRP